MSKLRKNPDGTKSGYKRPISIQKIFSRSSRWAYAVHHYRGPNHREVMLGGAKNRYPVTNEQIPPSNASQAAHDRLALCEHIRKLEQKWWNEHEKVRCLTDALSAKQHELEQALNDATEATDG